MPGLPLVFGTKYAQFSVKSEHSPNSRTHALPQLLALPSLSPKLEFVVAHTAHPFLPITLTGCQTSGGGGGAGAQDQSVIQEASCRKPVPLAPKQRLFTPWF